MGTRTYSLSYLTSHRCTPASVLAVAAQTGYDCVGLRLWPNAPGGPRQFIDAPGALSEALAVQRDTGVEVLDLELIRINEDFDVYTWDRLFEAGAAVNARAILVAGDDADASRLAHNYARLCEAMRPYGMTADLEFMPWTAVPDAQAALRVVHAAGNPANAGILVDALHVARSHTSLDDLRALPRSLLHYAQICDAQAGTHFSTEQMIHTARCERLQPGEGTIDLPALFAALPAELPVSVEVVNHVREVHFPPHAWAAQCLAASRLITG